MIWNTNTTIVDTPSSVGRLAPRLSKWYVTASAFNMHNCTLTVNTPFESSSKPRTLEPGQRTAFSGTIVQPLNVLVTGRAGDAVFVEGHCVMFSQPELRVPFADAQVHDPALIAPREVVQ